MAINERSFEDYPKPIFLEQTSIILKQMKTTVFYINCDEGKGTGFFFKIPVIGKLIPVFVTANHVIDENYLAKNTEIKINTNKDKAPKTIQLKNKFFFTDKDYDVTMIEIDENKDGEYEYLEPDDRILKEELIDNLKGTSIYTLQYPVNQSPTLAVSYGILKRGNEKEKYNFIHYCCTQYGSSGSPILNIENNKVIGIHKQTHEKRNYNIGSFLFYSMKGFIDKYYDECLKKYQNQLNSKKKNINNKESSNNIKNNMSQENKRYGRNNESKISNNSLNKINTSIAKSKESNKKDKNIGSNNQEKIEMFRSIPKELFGNGNQTIIKLKKCKISGVNDNNNEKLPLINPPLWEKKNNNLLERNQSNTLKVSKEKRDFI